MAEKVKVKKKFDISKPHMNIGGIGHVDHGKTTLIAAITKYLAGQGQAKFKDYGEIDKAPEEKVRGITINASHIGFKTSKRHYSWVDCPGHADYIKNMITGAAQMDGAVLICSAEDGAMAQTKEHLLLAKQIGIEYLVVFINKIDIVSDPEQLGLVQEEIKEELKKLGYEAEKIPFIRGSALCALEERNPEIGEKSILKLLEAVDNYIPIPPRDEEKPFLMYIEDVFFNIKGVGTVVSGKVQRGTLKKDDKLELVGLGETKEVVVKGMESFGDEVDEAKPGFDLAVNLNLRDAKKEEVRRGRVLAKPVKPGEPWVVIPHKKFKAHTYILSKEERGRHTAFEDGYRPQFFIFTADVTGTVKVPKNEAGENLLVKPGDNVELVIELIEPVVIEKNDRFTMREGGRTVGRGVVTEIIE
jgi:elongation factor Tu